ncbi:MAG TPA: hypothetical protein PK018_17380, partial [Candidatus Competibacter sp.]|nr:hypothetical protein [Candidatus Competibacter sp.]HRW67842.1 hypothetical protein [Candidatus Competibacter sp.]
HFVFQIDRQDFFGDISHAGPSSAPNPAAWGSRKTMDSSTARGRNSDGIVTSPWSRIGTH